MNDTTILEINRGFFAMIGKVLSNRAFLGMLVLVLVSWRLHDWWYEEDVCASRYRHADKVFQAETARKNSRTKRVEKSSTTRARMAEKGRAKKLQRVKELAGQHKIDAILPKANHGAIHDVR